MTDRERMLAVLNHQPPDRIPWIPRLKLWFDAAVLSGTLPQRFAGLSHREVQRAVGAGWPSLDGRIYRVEYEDVEIVESRKGRTATTEYHTPVGSVSQVTRHSTELAAHGLPGEVVEHLLKGPEDYAVWEWVVQHRHYIPTFDEFRTYDAEVGDDGLPVVQIEGVPIYDFLDVLVGFNDAYYHLVDYPDEVEHLLAVMTEVQRERLWPLAAASPAQVNAAASVQEAHPPLLRGGQRHPSRCRQVDGDACR